MDGAAIAVLSKKVGIQVTNANSYTGKKIHVLPIGYGRVQSMPPRCSLFSESGCCSTRGASINGTKM